MIKYLVILLDDTSVSYCHYENNKAERKLISLEDLRAGIFYAMKENMSIQFVYPDYDLTAEYKDAINTIDHSSVKPYGEGVQADVLVLNDIGELDNVEWQQDTAYVLRVDKAKLFASYQKIISALSKVMRLNVVITDVETFTEDDFTTYKNILTEFVKAVKTEYVGERNVQLNLLTDRIMLNAMNNCNAGAENITLAPDGRFYVCPGFYLAGDNADFGLGKAKVSVGDLKTGLDIKNPQLYRLTHAPICRGCDAYQCKRCVWLNRKTTYEVNTPSHEQCVMAHLERNSSRELLQSIREHGVFMPEKEIKEIDYLDPFNIVKD